MITLHIPTPLRPYTAQQRQVAVGGATVGEALAELTAQFPALKPHLFNEAGELRPFVNLYLNEEDLRHLQGVSTPLKDGDKLMILPSIAGGKSYG